MGAKGVIKRRDEVYKAAAAWSQLRNQLIGLGIFFHFQQDTWAHRHHYDPKHLSLDDYTTYNTPFGQALDGHQPDYPTWDPVAALKSLEHGVVYASQFLKEVIGRQPHPFLANYTPRDGKVDLTWKKRAKYYNQISLSDAEPGSARMYLIKLIRAQIDKYPQKGKYADLPDLKFVRSALEDVTKEFSTELAALGPIQIPTTEQKIAQGFNTMTTPKLVLTPFPDAPQFMGVEVFLDGSGKVVQRVIAKRDSLKGDWVEAPIPPLQKGVEIARVAAVPYGPAAGALIGIGTDNNAFLSALGFWQTAAFTGVISLAQLPDESFLVLHADGKLLQLTPPFVVKPIASDRKVISIAPMPDGTLLGVGGDNKLYRKQSLEGLWMLVPDNPIGIGTGPSNDSAFPVPTLMTVAVMRDGTVLGIGTDYTIYRRAGLGGPWTADPSSKKFESVVEMPLGTNQLARAYGKAF
jgi:hypothetical protein